MQERALLFHAIGLRITESNKQRLDALCQSTMLEPCTLLRQLIRVAKTSDLPSTTLVVDMPRKD
jgi:hypothetical protein